MKQFLHRAATLPLMRPLMSRYFRGRCNVVFTHFVGRAAPPHYGCFLPSRTDPDSFRQDIEQLSRQFEFVALDELLSPHTQGPGSGKRPRMALTIDDGLDIFDDTLLSIIADYDVKPCCFVITKYIDNTDLMWRHKLSAIIRLTPSPALGEAIRKTWPADRVSGPAPANAAGLLTASSSFPHEITADYAQRLWNACELPPLADYLCEYRPYLTWKRIAELREAGFGFGSHSHTHPAFDLLSTREAVHEMQHSRELLEQHLGPGDYTFAYPFGRLPLLNNRTEIEKTGGFSRYFGTYGFTNSRGIKHHFLQRICIEGGINSVELAPLYQAAALSLRLTGRHSLRT